jgi:hypothetical protein
VEGWIALFILGVIVGWMLRYAWTVRLGARHAPGAKRVWWIPGGGGHGGGGGVPPVPDDD